jgi:hypothetical protein
VTPSTEVTPSPTPTHTSTYSSVHTDMPPKYSEKEDDAASTNSKGSKTSFRPGAIRRSTTSNTSGEIPSEDEGLPGHKPIREREAEWGIGDDARMGLE